MCDREQYLAKRKLLLSGNVHFVEIDLLRGGAKMPVEGLAQCDYAVIVSRSYKRPKVGLWPMRIREALPVIPVPLKQEDPDAVLDLQQLLHETFDAAGYADVPLADARRGIAVVAEHARQREPTGRDQRRPADSREDRAAMRHTKRHLPRHQAVARRSADRARTVSIGESHSLAREPVDVRSRNSRLVVVAMHVPVAEVGGEDENDVRLRD